MKKIKTIFKPENKQILSDFKQPIRIFIFGGAFVYKLYEQV